MDFEYAVVTRANSIDVVTVVRGAASGLPYTDGDETGLVKTHRPSKKSERRVVMSGNSDMDDFETMYPTAEQTDEAQLNHPE